jgi:hypothetical protein
MATMQCCFHNQVRFNVRTGGQWSTVGAASGFMHHVIATGSDGRCQPACEARDALLNGRAPPVPRPIAAQAAGVTGCVPGAPTAVTIDRDSPLAVRNPMFSFLVWSGRNAGGVYPACDAPPARDYSWHFHTAGQYIPLMINIAGTTAGLSPQSMLYIDALSQLAVVDGETQGLILVDLNTLSDAHAPYQ